ncbi:MAG: translocation/assembly module TamB domain-containing protein [Amaricoccus sp.]
MKRLLLILFGLLSLIGIAALAQSDGNPDDNGFIVNMIQNQLSAPGRRIEVSGVTGLLSSRARIGGITVSDDKGPWLEFRNVEIDWTRTALLLGRVNVNRLGAEQVNLLRRPEIPPAPALERAEAKPFQLPELPVSIRLQELDIQAINVAEPVFGTAASLGVTGALDLARGALDSKLAVQRLDPPGGSLDLTAAFSNRTRQLALDLHLQEPKGGLLSHLLQIENQPAIDLRLAGNGPLDNMDITFALTTDGSRAAGGTVALRGQPDGLGFDADLDGALAPLIPAPYRAFFDGSSRIKVAGVKKTDGGLRLDTLSLKGAVLSLAGSLDTAADGFPRSVNLTGSLGDPAGPPVTLPIPGGRTSLTSAQLYVSYGGAARWNGLVVLDRLQAGDIGMEDVTLNLGGLAQDLDDPAHRNVTINVEGLATGVGAADADVARALGTRIDLFADAALPPGAPAEIRQFQISGNGLSIFSAGSFQDWTYTGRNAVRIDDIVPFAGLAGRDLGGGVDLTANGSVSPLSGGFDLALAGTATDLRLGDKRLDALLAGETTVGGKVVRDETGIRTEGLQLQNAQLSFASNGQISSSKTDFGFDAKLADLTLIDPRLAGAATATGRATGRTGAIDLSFQAAIPEGRLLDRPIDQAALGFTGSLAGTDMTGALEGGGSIGGQPITLAGEIASKGETRSVRGLKVGVGDNLIAGEFAQTGTGPASGTLSLRAPDIAPLAALALVEAQGAIQADLTLQPDETRQNVSLDASGQGLALGPNRIRQIAIAADISDALGVPIINGTLSGVDMAVGPLNIATLSARADQIDRNRMNFTASTKFAVGTEIDAAGALQRLEPGFALSLASLSLRQDQHSATLTAPVTVTLEDGNASLTPLTLDFGGTGQLVAHGEVADQIDVALDITRLPLDLVNAINPGLALSGTVDGTARVTGPRTAPNVSFTAAATGVEDNITRGTHLPPLNVQASGTTEQGHLRLDASVTAERGLSASVTGTAPLGPGELDLAVRLESFPLVLADRLAGNRGLTGTVTGTAQVFGPYNDIGVRFDLRTSDFGMAMLSANGVPPLGFTARGSFQRGVVSADEASVTGPGGMALTGHARVPLQGPGLDIAANGTVPLALADSLLAQRSAQAVGQVRVNVTVRGSLAAPQIGGTASLAGGTLVDPQTNIRLNDVGFDLSVADNLLTLKGFRASVAAGGTLSAGGTVRLDAGQRFPADMTLSLNNVRYTDGSFVTTRLSGDLALKGPVMGSGGLLSGTIDLDVTEISVAEGLGASAQATLEQVTHYRPSAGVLQTLARAKVGGPSAPSTGGGSNLGLDIRVRAPRQIFVRGRGLDVELGGELVVRGTISDIQPVGQFDLRRGRLSILGQRIEFEEGSLQLVGNLDPQIHFVARSQSEDVTAIVTVDGRASSPQITFSSEPELPQDEVLARLLFNRSTDNLSAFQLAQLAAAAAELAGGGGGNGLLEQLRSRTGLDDLDIITEQNGSTAVRAGKYLSQNVYVDVQTGSDGVSRVQVNLDINKFVSARGSVATDGNTTLGLFYERDY